MEGVGATVEHLERLYVSFLCVWGRLDHFTICENMLVYEESLRIQENMELATGMWSPKKVKGNGIPLIEWLVLEESLFLRREGGKCGWQAGKCTVRVGE